MAIFIFILSLLFVLETLYIIVLCRISFTPKLGKLLNILFCLIIACILIFGIFAWKYVFSDKNESQNAKITSPLDNILWLEPFENRRLESLIFTVHDDANECEPLFYFKMNDRVTEVALFFCSVLPLSNKTHHKVSRIPSELSLKFEKQDFQTIKYTADDCVTIISDTFYAKVSPSLEDDNKRTIFIKPLNPGTDILEISSPDCAYMRKIFLQAEEIE